MGLGRWHKGSKAERAAITFAASLALLGTARLAGAAEVAIVPSTSGRVGAWLALGPLLVAPQPAKKGAATPSVTADEPGADAAPSGSDANAASNVSVDLDTSVLASGSEERLIGARGRTITVAAHPRASAPTESATWRIVSSREGAIDLGNGLSVKGTGEAFALLSGVVRVTTRFDGALLVGATDGVRVLVDRKTIFTNDDRRAEHDDDYVLPLRLGPGDHPVLIKLRRRAGDPYGWAARVRLVDATLRPPIGTTVVLPGTDDRDARALAGSLVSLVADRGLSADGLRPTITARFVEGAPRGLDHRVVVTATLGAGGTGAAGTNGSPGADATSPSPGKTLFRLDAGNIPVTDGGAGELSVSLPFIATSEIGASRPTVTVEAAGRTIPLPVTWRPTFAAAITAARDAIALCDAPSKSPTGDKRTSPFLDDPLATRATIAFLRDRLASYVGRGDSDVDVLEGEAQTLIAYAADLHAGRDPLRSHTGIRRFAYPSPLDEQPSQFGIYVPPSYKPGTATKYPLVVALHGMNGKPIAILRAFFGHDDGHDSEWQDRHPGPVDPIEAFVISPNAYGNGMYRDLGEVDVMAALDWTERFFPIDLRRVTITGPSMGGTGAASIAFHYPDRFAAAEPLCGYHSYLIRGDLKGLPMRPWESLISEQRSNALWAENGLYLPLYIWHGTRDWPVKNSGVLIDRYTELGYSIEHEHPNVGHDVWKKAYADVGGFRWLQKHTIPEAPRHVLFKTDTLRYARDHWLRIDDLGGQIELGQADATISPAAVGGAASVEIKTQNVRALGIERIAPFAAGDPVEVHIDGAKLAFGGDAAIAMHREPADGPSGRWLAGPLPPPAPGSKRPGLSGPLRDVFFEPLVFVYGTLDPDEATVNEEVARYFARVRAGVDIRYPVMADVDLDDQTEASHALFLVGSARSNSVVHRLDAKLPFHVVGDHVEAAGRSFRGEEIGVAFVYPNPEHPDKYVVVVEGASVLGTLRAAFLPDLLPDFIVYDRRVAAMRGQIVLGLGKPVSAGLFDKRWGLTLPAERAAPVGAAPTGD